jgi:2,4-dienoyl-CoA reductase-like NADH-dependent reductase (Old Yellow Enzyme family)
MQQLLKNRVVIPPMCMYKAEELLRNSNLVQFIAKKYEQKDFIDSSYLKVF